MTKSRLLLQLWGSSRNNARNDLKGPKTPKPTPLAQQQQQQQQTVFRAVTSATDTSINSITWSSGYPCEGSGFWYQRSWTKRLLFPSILLMINSAQSYTCKFFIVISVYPQRLNITYIFAIIWRRWRLTQVKHAKTSIEYSLLFIKYRM